MAAKRNRAESEDDDARPSENEDSAKHRLQLEFTQQAFDRLQELRELTDARSQAEVIRKALHVYDWIVVRTQKEKYKLQLVKDDEVREVEMVLV